MMRSLYSGVAGLKTHQTKMDVIGNNIANVNTTSFKSQSITFSDLMYQTTQTASGASATRGGVNAKQIGLGAKSGAISTAIESQGATQTTNNPFDLMITGKSFFIIDDGTSNLYTRDGSFYVDGAGSLCMQSNGYHVLGWAAQEDPTTGERSVNVNGGLTNLMVMSPENTTYAPASTTASKFNGNIDKNDENIMSDDGKTVTLEFYDNRGYLYTAKFTLKDVEDENGDIVANQYDATLYDVVDSNNQSVGPDMLQNISFEGTYVNEDGETVGNQTGTYGANANHTIRLSFNAATGALVTAEGQQDRVVNLMFNQGAAGMEAFGYQKLPGDTTTNVAGQFSIDFSTVTNYNTNESSTVKATKGDLKSLNTGRAVGEMNGITVSTDGKINATYSNGQTKLLGQIATAEFANASGLSKSGDNLYASTLNSGDPTVQDISTDGGYMETGVLEMSNVDLSSEFTNMITTQRGFQANSRIITVSDTLLEELTNLKR